MATCHTCHDIVSAHYTACNKAHHSLRHNNVVTFLPAAQRAQHPCEHMSLLSASTGLYAWRQAAHASSFPRPGDAPRLARQSSRGHASLAPQHPSPSPSPGRGDAFSPPRRRSAARQRPNPARRSRCVGPPGFTARPAIPAPHPLTGLARSLSTAPRTSFPWPQPSAIPPRAYPQRLVPRAPRATALGRPARSPSAAPRASYPTSHSPRPSRQEPIHGASCLVSQTTCHQPPPQEPIHSASCLVPQATTLCPHTDATCCTLTQLWLQASPRATLLRSARIGCDLSAP